MVYNRDNAETIGLLTLGILGGGYFTQSWLVVVAGLGGIVVAVKLLRAFEIAWEDNDTTIK